MQLSSGTLDIVFDPNFVHPGGTETFIDYQYYKFFKLQPMEVEGALRELLNDLIGSWSGLIDLETIIRLIEALLEVL